MVVLFLSRLHDSGLIRDGKEITSVLASVLVQEIASTHSTQLASNGPWELMRRNRTHTLYSVSIFHHINPNIRLDGFPS